VITHEMRGLVWSQDMDLRIATLYKERELNRILDRVVPR
jgi:hypothetical protein